MMIIGSTGTYVVVGVLGLDMAASATAVRAVVRAVANDGVEAAAAVDTGVDADTGSVVGETTAPGAGAGASVDEEVVAGAGAKEDVPRFSTGVLLEDSFSSSIFC